MLGHQAHDSTVPRGRESQALSAHETQVVSLLTLGLTNAQIAKRLDVTSHAIKFHLASIYRKLGVTNRTEAAVAYVNEQGRKDS